MAWVGQDSKGHRQTLISSVFTVDLACPHRSSHAGWLGIDEDESAPLKGALRRQACLLTTPSGARNDRHCQTQEMFSHTHREISWRVGSLEPAHISLFDKMLRLTTESSKFTACHRPKQLVTAQRSAVLNLRCWKPGFPSTQYLNKLNVNVTRSIFCIPFYVLNWQLFSLSEGLTMISEPDTGH